jgi:hypothetical protein
MCFLPSIPDPCNGSVHLIMDPDPALSFINHANKKSFFLICFCLLLSEGTFTSFLNDKKSLNSRNQGFS